MRYLPLSDTDRGEMLARRAPRPAYSVLGTQRPAPIRLPHWRRGLAEYLAKRELAEAAA